MSSCLAFNCPRSLFFGRPEFWNFSGNKSFLVLKTKRLEDYSSKTDTILQFTSISASASSSPSLGGSGAEYSDQLLGAQPKKKKARIAGIDQDELLDPEHLADPDSCFCEFNGVQIHHKVVDADSPGQNLQYSHGTRFASRTKRVGFPMILLHGFGASVFSWNRVMKPLAEVTGSKVLAFDRPAFGLTSRINHFKHSSPGEEDTKSLNPYSMIFSVLATLYFIDFLAAEKAVLVGHSAGSLVAVQAYFEAPERVAALILVGPAILPPFFTAQNAVKGNKNGKDDQVQEDQLNSNIDRNPIIKLCSILLKFSKYIAEAIMHMVKGMANMVNSLYKKVLSALLRSTIGVMLVRMLIDRFGIPAIRNSWYDPNRVTDHVLHGYTKPLRVKGWDRALAEYTTAMLADSVSESRPPLTKRLNEISCPVLVVTGDSDKLVPVWNSERLSKAIPGSRFEVVKNCGHLPQEEKPEEFVLIIENFLRTVFGDVEAQQLQPAA